MQLISPNSEDGKVKGSFFDLQGRPMTKVFPGKSYPYGVVKIEERL